MLKNHLMENYKDKKSLKYYFLFFIIIVTTLYIALSFFVHPSTDDFYFANMSKDNGLLESQIKIYETFNGRYTSTFLLTFIPTIGDFSSNYIYIYKTVPIIMIILSFLSIIIFIQSLFRRYYSPINNICISSILFILYITSLPNINECFYWMTGSLSYQLGVVLLLLLFSILIYADNWKDISIFKKVLFIIGVCLLTVLVCGISEAILILTLSIVFIGTLTAFLKRTPNKGLFILTLIIALLCFVFVYLSPGNSIRSATQSANSHDVLYSLGYSIVDSIGYMLLWLTKLPVLLFILIFLPVTVHNAGYLGILQNLKKWHLKTMLILFPLIIWWLFFIPYWSTGSGPPPRMRNTIFFVFLLIILFFLLIVAELFKRRNKDITVLKNLLTRKDKPVIILMILTLLLSIAGLFFPLSNSPSLIYIITHISGVLICILIIISFIFFLKRKNNGRFNPELLIGYRFRKKLIVALIVCLLLVSNIPSVILGLYKANDFNSEMWNRYRIINEKKKQGKKSIKVPSLSNNPDVIHIDDITDDVKDWRNKRYAKYFELNSIRIRLINEK